MRYSDNPENIFIIIVVVVVVIIVFIIIVIILQGTKGATARCVTVVLFPPSA